MAPKRKQPEQSRDDPSKKGCAGADDAGVRRIPVVGGSEVLVGRGLLAHVPVEVAAALTADGFKASKYVVVSDETVWRLHGGKLQAAFEAKGIFPLHYAVKPGEKSKDRRVKEKVEDFMLQNHCLRDTVVIALGGGVVGDLAGFVAATYLRGVPIFQVPTSMMAMVDSSVGGKTAVNVPAGKNLIGAFHQPRRVFIDPDLLETLGRREVAEGLAEVIKMGVIRSAALFEAMEASPKDILALDAAKLAHVTAEAVRLKAEVVALDEKESGVRSTLNFGHTVGHAIEALRAPNMLHGECVAIGMVVEACLARDLGELTSAAVGRVTRLIKAYGLPTSLPKGLVVDDLLGKMKMDKKNAAGAIRCTIVRGIGTSYDEPRPVHVAHLRRLLSPALEVTPPPYGSLSLRIRVPGSKSISNRVLLMAALGEGTCRLRGLLHSDDTHVMLTSLQLIADVRFAWEEGGDVLRVDGCGGRLHPSDQPLYLGNAGTASRFLTTTCALIEAPGAPGTTLTGDPRMKERPIGDLTEALRKIGCDIDHLESPDSLPLLVRARGLRGGRITLSGKVSSQFVSSVLLSAPYAREAVELHVPEAVSQQYIEMTLALMADFDVRVSREGTTVYRVPLGVYKNPARMQVEADASSATYPLAIAAITGGSVTAEAIGAKSCQGDAMFHTLCETMGCTVRQTDTETTVTGPPRGVSLRSFDLDMESMTDAFMTAAVLAAVADGTSTITGIANQRVKECNRIEATLTELRKLGVPCEELADGIRVTGVAPDKFNFGRADIHCYKDHRIAMSFATLGCAVAGITLTDAACVDKTYPEFWSHLATKFGIGVDAPGTASVAAGPEAVSAVAGTSLVLVGMRGSGKSSLGAAVARELGRPHLDLDVAFEKRNGPVSDYVAAHEWQGFRDAELSVLTEALQAHPRGAVISCGGGVVETQAARAVLAAHPLVVHVRKADADVVRTLDGEGATVRRPAYGESTAAVCCRRAPLYAAVSTFVFTVREGDVDWPAVSADFVRFARRVVGELPPRMPACNSFFLSLTEPMPEALLPVLPDLELGVDALELRADLLRDRTEAAIADAISLLRRHTRCPLIFTLRTEAEGGKFAGSDAEYEALTRSAVRAAVEFIDIEVGRPAAVVDTLCRAAAPRTLVIGSHHDFGRTPTGGDVDPDALLRKCALGGRAVRAALGFRVRAAIAKLVLKAETPADSLAVRAAADRALPELQAARPGVGVIAICVGEAGKLSRVLNTCMTPVTHPKLTAVAAPGQLSAAEIVHLRAAQGTPHPGRRFCIFGSPVSKSPSPAVHNAAFRAHLMPHAYDAVDTADEAEVARVVADASFAGASVTIPLKEKLSDLIDEASPAAQCIGAINTLTRKEAGRLHGDNTDWVGIRACLSARLADSGKASSALDGAGGMVVGGGGTARAALYALNAMGVAPLYTWNRTSSKAEALAAEFGAKAVEDLSAFAPPCLGLVVGTVPSASGVSLPDVLLAEHKPVVLDAAYIPRMTPLLTAAAEAGCPIAFGAEMLFEQASAQFEIWTGRAAPRRAMAAAIAAKIDEPSQDLPPIIKAAMGQTRP